MTVKRDLSSFGVVGTRVIRFRRPVQRERDQSVCGAKVEGTKTFPLVEKKITI